MLPPDEMLTEELTVPTYEVFNGKIKVMRIDTMREVIGGSPDRLDALCLTFAPAGFFLGQQFQNHLGGVVKEWNCHRSILSSVTTMDQSFSYGKIKI